MNKKATYLKIKNLNKSFGQFTALEAVSIDIQQGDFVCFLGPSGCGKTTLLRCIAGLEIQTNGLIYQNERLISDLPTSQRDFGIVFQSYALFPNLSCFENIAYGLKNLRWSKNEISARVTELLELIGLYSHATKYPSQLSGGEQQRIALARALATSPNLLLLDEPLSALDAKVRIYLRQELKNLHRRLGLTTIMVTHDQEEALSIADKIFVMKDGRIMQSGSPEEIYTNPSNPFVANFIGMTNFIEGKVKDSNHLDVMGQTIKCDCAGFNNHDTVKVAIRPEAIEFTTFSNKKDQFRGIVTDIEFLGSFRRVHIETSLMPNEVMIVDKPINEKSKQKITIGNEININLTSNFLNIFKSDT